MQLSIVLILCKGLFLFKLQIAPVQDTGIKWFCTYNLIMQREGKPQQPAGHVSLGWICDYRNVLEAFVSFGCASMQKLLLIKWLD